LIEHLPHYVKHICSPSLKAVIVSAAKELHIFPTFKKEKKKKIPPLLKNKNHLPHKPTNDMCTIMTFAYV
jgi:hypothetical protein